MSAADDYLSKVSAPVPVVPAPAGSPSAQHAAPPQSAADAFLAGIHKKAPAQHDPSILQHIEATGQGFMESPVGKGLNAVLNATSNFGVGTADALAKGHGWKSFAEGVNAVTHPGKASDTVHDLETRMHLFRAGANAPWWHKTFQTAEDFAIQTALDPAMWIPGLDVASIVGKGLKVGKVAGKALTETEHIGAAGEKVAGLTPIGRAATAVAHGPVGKAVAGAKENVNAYFNADHHLDKLMTPAGKDVLKGRQAGQSYALRKLGDETDNAAGKVLKDEMTPKAVAKQFVKDHPDKLKPGVTEQDLATHLEVQKGHKYMEIKMSHDEPSLLQKFSRYGRDTLFLLPFAHMKNLSIMALLGPGGGKTLARGASYMSKIAKKDAPTLDKIENLKKLGLAPDYMKGVDAGEAAEKTTYSNIPGLGALSRKSTQALTDYDTAMRLALYDHLKKKGMDGYTIAGHIRGTMGDYGNASRAIEDARRVGANFPAWRMGVVPRAMTKAIKQQPKNVKMYAQASGDIENDKPFPGQGKAGFTAGSVPEDYSTMLSGPSGALQYGTSGSTIGPIADAEQAKSANKYGGLGKFAEGVAEQYVPFGSILSKVIPGANTFAGSETQANPLLQAVGGLVGVRFPDSPDAKKRRKQMELQGMKPAEIYKQLQVEGLAK